MTSIKLQITKMINIIKQRYCNNELNIDVLIDLILNDELLTPLLTTNIMIALLANESILELSNIVYIPMNSITEILYITNDSYNTIYFISNENAKIYKSNNSFYTYTSTGKTTIILDLDKNDIIHIKQKDILFTNIVDYLQLFINVNSIFELNNTVNQKEYIQLFHFLVRFDENLYNYLNNELQNILNIIGSYTASKGMLSKIRSINKENYQLGVQETENMLLDSIDDKANFIINILKMLKINPASNVDKAFSELEYRKYKILDIFSNNQISYKTKLIARTEDLVNNTIKYNWERIYNFIHDIKSELERTKVVLKILFKWFTYLYNKNDTEQIVLLFPKHIKRDRNEFDINSIHIDYIIISKLIKIFLDGVIINTLPNTLYNKLNLGIIIDIAKTMSEEYIGLFVFIRYINSILRKQSLLKYNLLKWKISINVAEIEHTRAIYKRILYINNDDIRLLELKSRVDEIRNKLLAIFDRIETASRVEILRVIDREKQLLINELQIIEPQYIILNTITNTMIYSEEEITIIMNKIYNNENTIIRYESHIFNTIDPQEIDFYRSEIDFIQNDTVILSDDLELYSNILSTEYHDIIGYKKLVDNLANMIYIILNKSKTNRINKILISYLFLELSNIVGFISNETLAQDLLLYIRTTLTNILGPKGFKYMIKVDILPIEEPIIDVKIHPINIMMNNLYNNIDSAISDKDTLFRKINNIINKYRTISLISYYDLRNTRLNHIKVIYDNLYSSYDRNYNNLLILTIIYVLLYERYFSKYNYTVNNKYSDKTTSRILYIFKSIFDNFIYDQYKINIYFALDGIMDIVGFSNLSKYTYIMCELDCFIIDSQIIFNTTEQFDNNFVVKSMFLLDLDSYIDSNLQTKYHIINSDALMIYIIGMLVYIKNRNQEYSTIDEFMLDSIYSNLYSDIYNLVSKYTQIGYFKSRPVIFKRVTTLLSFISDD